MKKINLIFISLQKIIFQVKQIYLNLINLQEFISPDVVYFLFIFLTLINV